MPLTRRSPESAGPNPRFRSPHHRSPHSLVDSGLVGKPASLQFWGRVPSRTISASPGVHLVYLRASPSPTRGRARSPCPGLLQLSEAQSLGAPQPLAVVGAFPRPHVGRAYRCSCPLRGPFSLLGRGSSGQTCSGPPAAHPAVRSGSATAHVSTQDPGSGRGMGRQLLPSSAQLAQHGPTSQGRFGSSAAPKTTPPGYHLSPDTDRPGDGTLLPG
ncbi:hypothetical protein NDU88_004866 [Pleurodeles waltl]|uniref:Uncharacterized protein n=1 Tax=Pleurodeles waltl TaxID=8319 RepID=A0AAV7RLQ7_PLEWA|nr:hypothetical protein NDU88_004866 [Pleurodeles waltl]